MDAIGRSRVMRAALLAPLMVIPASLIQGLASWMWSMLFWKPEPGVAYVADPRHPLETLFWYSIYGVPGAYLAIAIGVPVYLVLRHYRAASWWLAVAFGIMAAILWGEFAFHWATSWAFVPLMAYYGSVVGLSFWLLLPKAGRSVVAA